MSGMPTGSIAPIPGLEPTENPSEADVFFLRSNMWSHTREELLSLPHLKGNEKRHVYWCIGEKPNLMLGIPAMIFRCDATTEIVKRDPTTIVWPWSVKDIYKPVTEFTYDAVYVGQPSECAKTVVRSMQASRLKCFLQINKVFFGYATGEEYEAGWKLFTETLWGSRLSLIPNSEGFLRYRIYESMSAGRVFVHLRDNRILPFEDRIDYDKCSLYLKESDAPNIGSILENWLSKHSDSQITEMGLYGRKMWETWLNHQRREVFAMVIRERLGL